MIELNWFKTTDAQPGDWRTLSPVMSLVNGANMFWDVRRVSPGTWHIFLNDCRVWQEDGARPVICGSLHEAKCWVEDWERRALQRKMETGTVPLLNLRE